MLELVINVLDVVLGKKATPAYSKITEALRQGFPENAICSMFCGGKKCGYCTTPSGSLAEEQAIKGLYSSWYVAVKLFLTNNFCI